MMLDAVRTIFASIFIFGALVFIHELGHYWAARRAGVKVDVFSIGFGPVLKKWIDKRGTEWRLSVLPLGGFVRLHGFEHPEERTEEQRKNLDVNRSFHEKPLWSRVMVVAMGPLFNFFLAAALFMFLFLFYGHSEVRPNIAEILPNSAAEKAGILVGDRISAISGHKIGQVREIQRLVAGSAGKTLPVEIRRSGIAQPLVLPVKVEKEEKSGSGRIGVGFEVAKSGPVPAYRAIPMAVEKTWQVSEDILSGLGEMFAGRRSVRELGGTIRIVQMSGRVASYGMASVLAFMALLSINLGLLNLFPIPVLDGGRLCFYAAEAAAGRPLSLKAQNWALQLGLAAIAAIFAVSTYNDLSGLGLLKWMHGISGKLPVWGHLK